MEHPQVADPRQNHIRAVFGTSAAFFDVPGVTTYEELAERLCLLGERHGGSLTRIDIEPTPRGTGENVHLALVAQLASF